jgi:hypothetical protein
MINETQAKEFALGLKDPAVPDIQKFKMATALDEYFKAEDLNIDKGVKKAFMTDTVEGVEINDDIMAGFGAAPEDIANIKKGAANTAWISRQEKKPVDYFSLTLPAYQDAYAQQVFKLPKKNVTNDEFYNLVRENYKAQDNAHNFAFGAAARDLTADSAMREFDVGLTGSPVAGRIDDYHQSIQELHMEYTQKLAPYRTIIDQAAKTIEGMDQTPSNVFNKLTDSLVFGKEFEVQEKATNTFSKLAESLLPLPAKERLLVINAIGEVGAANPKEKKAYLEKIAVAMEREIEKGITGAANLAESSLSSFASGMYYDYIPELKDVVSGYTAKRRELQIIAGQIRMMAQSKINPIEGENWFEDIGLGVARMVPLMAATAISGPGAIAIMTGQFKDDVVVSAVNEGATIENAEKVALIASPIMAGAEYITNALPLNKIKIPFIDKWLKASTTSIKSAAIRLATRGTIGTGTEIGEEILQTATPLQVQDMLSDWQSEWSVESGISKADWDERMPKIADIAKETFGPALVISFLMAGRISIADVKNARALMTSQEYMVKSGISPDLANQITVEGLKGNYNEVDALFRQGVDKANKATPEQIKEANRRLNIKKSAALEYHNKIRQDYGIGPVTNLGNGKYQFTTPILRDGKNEIIDSGVSAQFNSLSEANEAWMLYAKNRGFKLRKMEQEFIASMVANLEPNQSFDISLMDYVMPVEKFTELFPSAAAQVEERVKLTDQIEGAVEDVAFENATLESEAKDNKNYFIYGTNSIEQREGISTGVITIYKGGGILDVIEESAEVGVKRMMNDPMSRTKLILQIRDVEAKMKEQAMQMGQKHMPLIATADDDQVSNMEIIEAFSHIAKSYYVQTAKAVERPTFDSDMPLNLYLGSLQSSIAGMELKDAIDLVGEKTLNILYRASQIKAVYDANGMNQDFINALEKSVGLNVSNRNADAVVDTAANLAADAGVSMSMDRVTPAQDAEYLELAKNPEKNRTLLQKMVDAVAKAAGATDRLQHWTNSEKFTRFDPAKIGTAQGFTGTQVTGFWFNDANGTRSPFGSRKIDAFLILKNPKIFESAEAFDAAAEEFDSSELFTSNLIDQRHDGVIIRPAEEWMGSQEWDFTNYVAFNPSQIKSADPVTYDANGNVIPLSQRFNEATPDINFSMGSADEGPISFSLGRYTKESANDLADKLGISSTIDREYLNRVILPIMADLMAGGTGVGVPWEGGPIHPLLHYGTDVAWRSARGAIAGILGYLDKRGGVWKDTDGHEWALVAVFAMSQDAHQSNNNMFMSFMNAVEASNPTDAQKLALAKMMKAAGQNALNEAIKKYNEKTLPNWEEKKVKSKAKYLEKAEERSAVEAVRREKADQAGKKYKPLRPLDKYEEPKKPEEPTENRLMNFPEQWTAQEMEDYVKTLIYPERADVMNRLKKQDGIALGLPDVETAIRQGRDDSYDMITGGSMLNVIKVDVTRLRVGLRDDTLNASDFGVPEHLSYDTVLPGEIVTHLRQPVPMNVAFPDMVREMKQASPDSSPTYLMQAKLPESVKLQKLTPKVFNAINDVQKLSIPRNRALMMISALDNKWEVAQKGKSKNIASYMRAVKNSVATSNLVSMTEPEIKAALKNNTLKIYKLPGFAVFFAIKKNADGTMEMFNAISNELALKGAMDVMMHKALSEGANMVKITNVITDKKPLGVLASLFSNHGWKIESKSKGSSEISETQEAEWTSMGWDKARHPKPMELVMRYERLNTNQISASPERLGKEDAGSIFDRTNPEIETESTQASQSDVEYQPDGTDGAGASGNVGGYRGSIPRGGDSIVAELAGASKARLEALGLTAKERDEILKKVGANPLQEGTTFSMQKANRKNSLRVLITKKALTDAALNQMSWKDWYSEHQATLDEFFGDYAELFQKILSVTSQASSVKANVGLALKAFGQLMRNEEFDGKLRGEDKGGYLPAVISNLNAIKNNLAAKGRKISNYTSANEGDQSRVVVDRHIARLLFGVDTPSKSQYDKAEKLLTNIANEIGWSPSQVQAALWAHSIVQSGKTPESYGAYLKKLESKPLTRKELKDGLIGNQLTKRIGNITSGGNGIPSIGTGRGRYSATSPTFSVSRSGGGAGLQQTRDGGGRAEGGILTPLQGAPRVEGATGPDAGLNAVAEDYARSIGLDLRRQAAYASIDEDRAQRIAAAYEAMPHAPSDPKVKEAYANLITQTIAQYRALEKAGYQFWFIDPSNDNGYGNSPYNAMRDVRTNRRMGVFPTNAGFGSGDTDLNVDDNPMLAETGIAWPYGSPEGQTQPVLANDLFRAVHDAFGHGLEGAGFRARGEENAWQAHVRLFTGSAVGAITSETRGQNSWLNFNTRPLRESLGDAKAKALHPENWDTISIGEHNQNAKTEDTIFADQKTGLMPEWTWAEGRVGDESPDTNFSISRSDFTGRIEQSLRPIFEGSPEAKLKIGMMALKRAQKIAADSLYDVGRPGAAKRKLAEMEASRIKKLAKVTDKTPDWVKKSLEKETTPEQAKAALMKDKLNGWIQMHDAIISSMPTEIRGTIGSISTLAKLSSDEARLRFIEDRMPKVEKAIEKYLKKGYGERLDKMLEAAAVKGKAGDIPKSKFIVTVQDELNTIIAMSNLSDDETVKEAARYEAEIISAQTSEDAADAFAKSQLLEIFGDLYGKQTTAEEMDVAHEYLKDLMKQGRDARKVLDEARAAEVAKMVEQAKADAFAGDANAATVQRGKDKGKGTTKGMIKGFLREHGSHRFVLSSVFGRSNKTADQFDERMILGVNAFETRQAARKKSLRDFMRSLYGTKSKISLDIELEKMETKVERSRVTKMEGEVREKDTKTVEEVERIIKSPSTFGYSAEEAQMWEDEMDAWSNLPTSRKRNLTIERIKVKGTRIEIPLSQMEAVYMAMALRQPGILDQQTVHGYDNITQAELEDFMSDKAKNWLAWFGAEYANEYDAANEVFMRLFNTRMPQIQFYAPLLKNHQGNQASLDPLNSNVVSQSANPGAVKTRRGRTSSLRIESALAVYQSHFAQMDYWINMAEYLRDTQAVMLNPEVRAAIQSEHGDEAMQAVSAWVQLEMARGVSKGALLIHSSRMMRNVKSGIALKALAFNIGTSIKTLSSVFYSLGEISIPRWPAAFARGIQHWSRMWDTNIIQNRLELGGTPEIREILANRGKSKNIILRLVENALLYGSMPTQYADAVLTSYSAAMVYGDRLAQAENANVGDEAAHKYAAREMEIAVPRTAQPNNWSGRSLMQNDATGVFNLLSMFSSDPQQKLSLVGEAIMKWRRGGSTNEEVVRKVLAYWVIPGLMFQVANAVTRSMFKDDDEEWEVDNFIRAALVGPLQGLFILGAAAEFFIASAVAYAAEKITGEEQDKPRNWRSSANPLVDISEQFWKSIEKLPEKMEDEDYLGGAWEIMKAGGALSTPLSPAGAAPGVADRVFKDTTTLFYGKEED